MPDSVTLLDMFVRGLAVGALLITGLAVWRSAIPRHARLATLLGSLSIAAWLICESARLRTALGPAAEVLNLLAFPVGGFFWLFAAAVFEDRPVNAATLAPAGVLLATGCGLWLSGESVVVWAAHNLIAGALCLHAGFMVLRGWRDDLIEGRRRLRGFLFGFSALFGAGEVVIAMAYRFEHWGLWLQLQPGAPYGGLILAGLTLAAAVTFLQARPDLFGAARRVDPAPDARAEAADRHTLTLLEGFMAAGGWRREGLTIGALAREIEAPEHRLRRLINRRLGHRNFADFVNGYRIQAAKQRLADPVEARTTVAAIAFDLGYGSLGPFNRAFREATGSTPTEWRRAALQSSPTMRQAV